MLERLLELQRKVGGRPVIIPTADHYALALARHRDTFERCNMIPCIGRAGAVDVLVDKLSFSDWVSTGEFASPRAASAAVEVLPFTPPVVVKPLNFTDFLISARELPRGRKPSDLRFTLIRSEAEWQEFRSQYHANLGSLLVQEYVEGCSHDMFSIGVYADHKSRLLGIFVGRKLRGYPAQYGNTIVGQNDRVPPHVLTEVATLTREIGYHGVAEFEYRRDPSTGQFHLLEVNPRCWSWIGATAGSAADIPWIAYRDLCGVPLQPVIGDEPPGSIKSVRVIADMANVFWRYRRDHPAWLMGPRAWLRSLAAEKTSIVEWERGDFGVALFCLALQLRDMVKGEH